MKLFDAHAHTTVSYCAERDLTLAVYRAALDDPRGLLGRQAITNHGFQAYFPEDLAWSWAFLDQPQLFDRYADRGEEVLLSFCEEMEALRDDRLLFGVEVELMCDGRLTVSPPVRQKAQLLVGSLHVLPHAYEKGAGAEGACAAFLDYNRDLLEAGVDVLAHPFRWLADTTGIVPIEIVSELILLVSEFGAAIELNLRGAHGCQISMIQEAVAAGVPIALATDSHAVWEVGRLEGHLEYIGLAGFHPSEIALYEGRGKVAPWQREAGKGG